MSKLTGPQVKNFQCPPGKAQAFLWDSLAPGLAVRATQGAKGYVFQSRFNGKSLRITIGDVNVWALEEALDSSGTILRPGARQEARRLQALIDQGRDPRLVKAEMVAADAAKNEKAARRTVTVGEAWDVYIKERRPHWSALHLRDHLAVAQAGGETRERRKNIKTVAGPLAEFMGMRLVEVTSDVVLAWAKRESPKRPTRTRLALRLFRAFLRWAGEEPAYRGVVSTEVTQQKKLRDIVGGGTAKHDCLQREQLKPWFAEVRKLQNPVQAAYLQTVLLTGARRQEVAGLRWVDIDFRWGTIRLHDKVEKDRIVPLTPFVREILLDLRCSVANVCSLHGDTVHRPSPWVFSAASRTGHIAEPRSAHQRVLKAAGLPSLSLHGLRRSFGTLSEWVECPTGVVAQLQGHKPSATAEKHYRQRPVDLLRLWSERIEVWMLEQAGLEQPKQEAPVKQTRVA